MARLMLSDEHECKVAAKLIEQLPMANYIIADKGYDCEDLRQHIRQKSSRPIIPRKNNSKIGNADPELETQFN